MWALPFLTALCPSERYHRQGGQHHKALPEWAGQLIGLIQRWLPGRAVIVVADSSYAVIELLKQVSDSPTVSLITRLRLDAALYDSALPRAPGQTGRPRKKGARRPTLQHVLTDPHAVDTAHGQQLVWRRKASGGGLYRHGRVVSQRLAARLRALGLDS